jgi:hypothetical protein
VHCDADISHRFPTAKACLKCSQRRNARKAASSTASARKAGQKREQGNVRLMKKTGDWSARVRFGGSLITRRVATREEAEKWCAYMAAQR